MNNIFLEFQLKNNIYNNYDETIKSVKKYLSERWAKIYIDGCTMQNLRVWSSIYELSCEYGIDCGIIIDDINILNKIEDDYANMDIVIIKNINENKSIETLEKIGIKVKKNYEYELNKKYTEVVELI